MNRLYFGDNLEWLRDPKEFPDAGVLITLDNRTKSMREEAIDAGRYTIACLRDPCSGGNNGSVRRTDPSHRQGLRFSLPSSSLVTTVAPKLICARAECRLPSQARGERIRDRCPRCRATCDRKTNVSAFRYRVVRPGEMCKLRPQVIRGTLIIYSLGRDPTSSGISVD